MRVLLTNPPWHSEYGEFYSRVKNRTPQMGSSDPYYTAFPWFLAYTAAILEKDGHEVFMIDCFAENMSEKKYLKKIEKISPEVVIIETSTPTLNSDLTIAKRIKEQINPIVIFSGTHASVFPRELIKNNWIDIVFVGEYELTAKETLNILEKKRRIDLLKKVRGLVLKSNGKIVYTGKRELIKDLDSLPYPARDLLPLEKYYDGLVGSPQIQMMSMRGCVFKCPYCLWPFTFFKHTIRLRDPKKVVDEIEFVIEKYKPKYLYFDDDIFTFNTERVMKFCRELEIRDINIKWGAMTRPELLTEKLMEEMYSAGCVALKIGVESANYALLKKIKRYYTLSYVRKIFKTAKKIGIKTQALYILGLPGENEESIKRTIRFSRNLSDKAQFLLLTPYPGTPFYELYKKRGWLIDEKNWELFNPFTPSVNLPGLSPKELKNFQIKAYKNFYMKKLRFNALFYSIKKDGMKRTFIRSILWLLNNLNITEKPIL
ncbi:MAG: radical SAM protein [Candidatus Aenigmatarchaeota archaeon]